MKTTRERNNNRLLATLALAGLAVAATFAVRRHVAPGKAFNSKLELINTVTGSRPYIVSPKVTSNQSDSATRERLANSFGKLPLSFEPNVGQVRIRGHASATQEVQFLARGSGYTLFLDPNEAVLKLRDSSAAKLGLANAHRLASSARSLLVQPEPLNSSPGAGSDNRAVVNMKLLGVSPAAEVVGLEELPGKVNYFRGNDPARWRTNVPTYAKVTYEGVYPGVDLVYYGNQGQLEYDFVVAPGADPSAIRLHIEAARETSNAVTFATDAPLRIDASGDLVIGVRGGEVKFHKPVVYQPSRVPSPESRLPIDGHYKLAGRNQVSFELGSYDPSRPLVIDPTLAYSTYLGGSRNENDEFFGAIAVDSSGNAYLTGDTDSTDFPLLNPFQGTHGASDDSDAFVTKFNSTGTALLYSTYLGGGNDDYATGLKVDGSGHAFVVGTTCSSDFPVTSSAYQTKLAAPCVNIFGGDLFITKFSATGSALVFSTYLGGTNDDYSEGIAIDSAGNSYVTGFTQSTDFPVTPGVVQSTIGGGIGDGFIAKFNPMGKHLVYSTFLGGSGYDIGIGVVVDSSANAYVAGATNSTNFPVTPGAFQTIFGGNGPLQFGDAFVTKVNATASSVLYSTYLGGSSDEIGFGIAIDKSGDAFVTGDTSSANFPVTPLAYQVVYGGAGSSQFGDVFVSKLNPAGSSLVYSTYVGADADEIGEAIALDGAGNAYVTGYTTSADFPTTSSGIQRIFGGAGPFDVGDAFMFQLSSSGSSLLFSTFLGGSLDDAAGGVALDHKGGVYISGGTCSTNFPTTPGAYKTTCGTDGQCNGACNGTDFMGDAFVTKIQLP